ncbi:uncharacterized protein N7515_010371 [Penicillium bovifimosum]|uniref:Uncharacterized protein n=1 Tax=Penicillium bovifimosum TaxID=126998 RepID=A0A9W9GEX3_9EURO|nr:uncharacterized protein N7515_010371 [Penicillium bovifimosum]KAJ5118148.1 hypothetical protein N7515_010371 [Penicillium bovifimosum]
MRTSAAGRQISHGRRDNRRRRPGSDRVGRRNRETLNTSSSSEELDDFKPRDLGYFDPRDDRPFSEVLDKQRVYHNVSAFINAAKVTSANYTRRSFAKRFWQCLLGDAIVWYNNELDEKTRARLRRSRHLDEWYTLLSEKFAVNYGDAVKNFQKLKYTLWDVYERHDSADFLQKVALLGQGPSQR